jgi:Fe-S cluster biogenesis protein NfuA
MKSVDEIKITGEPTMDPQVCKFILNRDVFSEGSFNCRSAEMASGSPLLEALFEIDGISQVMVSGATLTIAKDSHEEWSVMGQKIGVVIREQFSRGGPVVDPNLAKNSPSEDALRVEIEKLFADTINPQIESHGGSVELADVEGTTVYLRLAGGCQGCSSANATLKQGIEKAIRQVVPEITDVVDVTDHGAGENPYYS